MAVAARLANPPVISTINRFPIAEDVTFTIAVRVFGVHPLLLLHHQKMHHIRARAHTHTHTHISISQNLKRS